MATTTKQGNHGWSSFHIPALDPKTRRRDATLHAEGLRWCGLLRDLVVPRIVEGCRQRGWRNVRDLVDAFDVVIGVAATHGEHDGSCAVAPAFELSHPIALEWMERRKPSWLRRRRLHGEHVGDELQRSADRMWRRLMVRLEDLRVILYRPGRGLAKGRPEVAARPSIYGLPPLLELLGTERANLFLASTLQHPRERIRDAHYARKSMLWCMLEGAITPWRYKPRRPRKPRAQQKTLARYTGWLPSWMKPRARLAELVPAPPPPPPPPVAPEPFAAAADDAGWRLIHETLDAVGTKPKTETVFAEELPGHLSSRTIVLAGGSLGPLLEPSPPEVFRSECDVREELANETQSRTGIARAAPGGLRPRGRASDDGATLSEAWLQPERGSGRETCGRCEDSGSLPPIGTTPPRSCPDCSPVNIPPPTSVGPNNTTAPG